MEDQSFRLMMERFDSQDEKLKEISTSIKEHVEKDETYWKKIDVQEGQIALIKGIGSSSILAALGTYLWNKFH